MVSTDSGPAGLALLTNPRGPTLRPHTTGDPLHVHGVSSCQHDSRFAHLRAVHPRRRRERLDPLHPERQWPPPALARAHARSARAGLRRAVHPELEQARPWPAVRAADPEGECGRDGRRCEGHGGRKRASRGPGLLRPAQGVRAARRRAVLLAWRAVRGRGRGMGALRARVGVKRERGARVWDGLQATHRLGRELFVHGPHRTVAGHRRRPRPVGADLRRTPHVPALLPRRAERILPVPGPGLRRSRLAGADPRQRRVPFRAGWERRTDGRHSAVRSRPGHRQGPAAVRRPGVRQGPRRLLWHLGGLLRRVRIGRRAGGGHVD